MTQLPTTVNRNAKMPSTLPAFIDDTLCDASTTRANAPWRFFTCVAHPIIYTLTSLIEICIDFAYSIVSADFRAYVILTRRYLTIITAPFLWASAVEFVRHWVHHTGAAIHAIALIRFVITLVAPIAALTLACGLTQTGCAIAMVIAVSLANALLTPNT